MGRAPCCDKANVKKGPWSPEEDATLKAYIEQHGTGGNWIALPQKIGLKRCGKSCRLRWLNYLRPNIKHGGFSEEEDNIICSLYISIGSRWSIIAAQLPGRTDNDIKNYWNTRLKKKLLGKQRKEQQARRTCGVKQETKNDNENVIITDDAASQNPYWLAQPTPMTVQNQYQDPPFNDQASIRKLLIKLGGRFSDNDQPTTMNEMNLHCPLNISTDRHFYENSINMVPSSTSTDSFSDICSSLLNNQYNSNSAGIPISQDPNILPVEISDTIYVNPQRLEGMDCYYGVGMMSDCNGTNSGDSASWRDIGNSIYPTALSNYEDYQQGMLLQDCIISDSTYFAVS